MGRSELRGLLESREIARLKAKLSGLELGELAAEWEELPPMERLAVFKLLVPDKAMAFFKTLSYEERYRVFCGFEPGAIAPLVEDLPPGRAALFERLGPDAYREMLRLLS